jgi:hypothetical protein
MILSVRKFLFVLFLFQISNAFSEELVLTDSSLGSMKISVGMELSLIDLIREFPTYKITHTIGSGDSPDYHKFLVSTFQNEDLFAFYSFIETDDDYRKGVVKLDEIAIFSPKVKDKYGISTSSTLSEINEKRAGLEFGAGHMDNYLGAGKIWYMFDVNGMHGTMLSKESAFKQNPKINVISWPGILWR